MTIINFIVLILAIIGVYHIIEHIRYSYFIKQNKQFLKDFFNEYDKKNNNKTIQ